MMILGISGKINSGKTTLCNFLQKSIREIRGEFGESKILNLADPIKEMARDLFNLDPKLLWGTKEDKETFTHIYKEGKWGCRPYTYRELLQYLGSLFRSMDPNCWVNALLSKCYAPYITYLIGDVRFPNEVEGIQRKGGKVIRLTRNQDSLDTHESETALDGYKGFDLIIDNQNLNLNQTQQILAAYVKELHSK